MKTSVSSVMQINAGMVSAAWLTCSKIRVSASSCVDWRSSIYCQPLSVSLMHLSLEVTNMHFRPSFSRIFCPFQLSARKTVVLALSAWYKLHPILDLVTRHHVAECYSFCGTTQNAYCRFDCIRMVHIKHHIDSVTSVASMEHLWEHMIWEFTECLILTVQFIHESHGIYYCSTRMRDFFYWQHFALKMLWQYSLVCFLHCRPTIPMS